MKKLLYTLLVLWICCSCQDDKAVFDISMPQEGLTFKPVAGGAIMRYKLPADPNVIAIRIRYQDVKGTEIIRTGSYANDSLLLIGFNEGRKAVRGLVTLCDRDDVESEPTEVFFDTESSGPIAFFEKADVQPGYGGFQVSYDIPEASKGLVHVFYVGINPQTQKLDTLQVESFQLKAGSDTLTFEPMQVLPSYTVIVRTEDFRGYKVKEKSWENIVPFQKELLKYEEQYTLDDPEHLAKEDSKALVGIEYLFDGDKKGETCFNLGPNKFKTYIAGPMAIGKTLFTIDLLKEKYPAEIRLYCLLKMRGDLPYGSSEYGVIWNKRYQGRTPCKVSVFGTNTPEDENSWQLVTSFEQERMLRTPDRWCGRGCIGNGKALLSQEECLAAEPAYMRLAVLAGGKSYRYLKVVLNDIFSSLSREDANAEQWVTIHELEVFTRKEK